MQKKHFILLALLILTATNYAHAKEKIPDQFRIALGGFAVVRYDSLMSLTEPNLGAGISISPEDTLGLSSDQVVTTNPPPTFENPEKSVAPVPQAGLNGLPHPRKSLEKSGTTWKVVLNSEQWSWSD